MALLESTHTHVLISYPSELLLALLELGLQDAVVFVQVGVLFAQRRQFLLRRLQTVQRLQHVLCSTN